MDDFRLLDEHRNFRRQSLMCADVLQKDEESIRESLHSSDQPTRHRKFDGRREESDHGHNDGHDVEGVDEEAGWEVGRLHVEHSKETIADCDNEDTDLPGR